MKEFIEKLIGRLEEERNKRLLFEDNATEEEAGWYFGGSRNGLADAILIVNELAEEHNGGWIPCSERLPEPGKRYLVSGVWKDKDFEKHSVYDAVYGTDGIWHTYEYKPTMYEVIAWQPLPTPYTEK